VNLWGESPMYENLQMLILMNTNKSTSRRQGRFREELSERPERSVRRAAGESDQRERQR